LGETGKLKKKAKREEEDLRLTIRRAKRRVEPVVVEKARELGDELREARKSGEPERMRKALEAAESYVDDKLSDFRPNAAWETVKALFIALMVALLIRWFLIEPFRIPSGSMIPTLLVGDQLMVNKMSYGPDMYLIRVDPDYENEDEPGASLYSVNIGDHRLVFEARKLWLRRLPKRGEVVVFRFPQHPREDYIKRVIGLPGDVIELKGGVLYINGARQEVERTGDYDGPVSGGFCSGFDLYKEELTRDSEELAHDIIRCKSRIQRQNTSYGPIEVPEGMLFMMGDNRDQSSDSRSWGFVPVGHLKGKAMFVHLPLNPENHYLPRWDRFFQPIK